MTILDIFAVVVAIAVLVGIGLGVHFAFQFSDPDNREEGGGVEEQPYFEEQKVTSSTAEPKVESEKLNFGSALKKKRKKDKKLAEKVKQPTTSFAEFDCQFTGENPQDKIRGTMHQQDDSYHVLQSGVEKE